MLPSSRVLIALALAASAFAASPTSPRVAHESRAAPPRGWAPVARADAATRLPLRIALAQPNLATLEAALLTVSHPSSPDYGAHWSPAHVAETFRPTPEAAATVRAWLADAGVAGARLSRSGGWVETDVSVAEAEALLGTEYFVYRHADGREQLACEGRYNLPEDVAAHVDLVLPTLHFDAKAPGSEPVVHRRDKASKASQVGQPGFGPNIFHELEQCDTQITPDCIRALYGFHYEPRATSKNSIGIVEYTPQQYVPSDMDMFFTNFSTSQVSQRPVMESIDGGNIDVDGEGYDINAESNLDLQYAMSLVGKSQKVTLYQVGDLFRGASFNTFLDAIDGSYCTFEGGDDPTRDPDYPDPYDGGYKGENDCGTVSPAHVISTSYSYDEAELTPAYMERQCAEYAKLGLMGVTVLYSSGDYGVGGYADYCLDDTGAPSYDGTRFSPSFLAGAREPDASVTDPESACEQVIYSGGGFSNVFAMPSWQKDAVSGYLTKYPPPHPTELWNATGSRAYPDLSANGANYVVAIQGEYYFVYGTSASAPVVAAMLSAANDARLAVGKKPIGFINPTIYSKAFTHAFNDITNGTNPGCGTVGFSAKPGWDPVTGMGTPNFPALLKEWLLLP
ncbi:subtilisin-like protein [Epithele typhae]|uniref:subtilisin-like protein n=1 Tax=Epithele typhae TaxID=378194 RepID=UPI00200816B6|nr:subtilisin-like protein [Epithele typhae]KAH9933246.1 subtilisin-like protein [Epithele typhae]